MATQYGIQIVGNAQHDGHTEYLMKVNDANTGETWDLSKRYREVRELHEHLKLKYPDRIPNFPGKRLFGNNDPVFIRQRQQGLQVYLNEVIKIEPDCRTKALFRFLHLHKRPARGANTGQPEAVSPVDSQPPPIAHEELVENTQNAFIDLAQSPAPLDPHEVDERTKKYMAALKSHVINQPVDPIFSQDPNIDRSAPRELSQTPAVFYNSILDASLDDFVKMLRPDKKIVDPDALIVPFPPCE